MSEEMAQQQQDMTRETGEWRTQLAQWQTEHTQMKQWQEAWGYKPGGDSAHGHDSGQDDHHHSGDPMPREY